MLIVVILLHFGGVAIQDFKFPIAESVTGKSEISVII